MPVDSLTEKVLGRLEAYLLLLSSLPVDLSNEISNLTFLHQAVQMQNCLVASGEDGFVFQQIEYLQSPTGQ